MWQIDAGPKVDLKRDDNDATLCNVIIFSSFKSSNGRKRDERREGGGKGASISKRKLP